MIGLFRAYRFHHFQQVTRGLAVGYALWAVGGLMASCKTIPSCPPHTSANAAKVVADHAVQVSTWGSIQAEARVTQWSERGRIRGTVLMFLRRPDKIRFDVMSQFGPALVLTSDGEQFQMTDYREHSFFQGGTCSANIQWLLGIPMDTENLVRLLSGDTPLLEANEESMLCRGGRYIVTLQGEGGRTQELAFVVGAQHRDAPLSEQRLELRRSTMLSAEGERIWEITYGRYRFVDGIAFPMRVQFVDNERNADTSIVVKSIKVNTKVPEQAFKQSPRPGMQVQELSCP